MKITAIHGGGDWYDASAEYLVVPASLDLEAERAAYCGWYRGTYIPSLGSVTLSGRADFKTFFGWLIAKGAREPTEDELEIVEDAP